ncbi:lysophosphatidylserine lipase ABHD12-like [Leguminivora glycinivorella]|uniref:lysophosphatidylserine lipase ABHD12-like n=1 Tax=Leguminivora glycinivorella TaxID=1035111 RepID=UPI00200DD53C|nr:lysophosphatidylserine lipase ABHD12-like [Leguminivora glycinivorella]
MVVATFITAGASVTASLFIFHIAVLPLLFKYSKFIQRKIVFSNCVNYPRCVDYENPSKCNIIGGRNFQVEFFSEAANRPVKIGAWQLIPYSLCPCSCQVKIKPNCNVQTLQQNETPIVLYCHGNSNHRASPHRLLMYQVFQSLNFHVITFDYRGYGDSTRIRPTEAGVVEDAFHMYAWIMENIKENKPKVLIWGHSLGTAVASNLVANLDKLSERFKKKLVPLPYALILEAAFNNLCDEIAQHPLSKLVSWLPYYKGTFLKPFQDSPEYAFRTDQHLKSVPELPILLIHAKGDKIVPYELATRLHWDIKESRLEGGAPIMLHPFSRGQGLGHNNICEAESLPQVVTKFMNVVETYHSNKPSETIEREDIS